MAKAEQSTDGDRNRTEQTLESDEDVLSTPIVLEASGPATQTKHVEGEGTHMTVQASVDVSVDVKFGTVRDVLAQFFTTTIGGEHTVDNGMRHAARSEMKDIVDARLESMNCHVGLQTYQEQWDVSLDGPVESWLAVFEHSEDATDDAERLVRHDCVGSGVRLALGELKRRRGESVFPDDE